MHRRYAAPDDVAVHDVVVDEGEVVGQFERKGGREQVVGAPPLSHRIRSEDDDRRAEAFAARKQQVGARPEEIAVDVSKVTVERFVYPLSIHLQIVFKRRHRCSYFIRILFPFLMT